MEKVGKKAWFRDYLVADVEDRLHTKFGNLDHTAQSKEMSLYYVNQILSKILPGLVPEDEADLTDGVVDGRNDLGVDFISRSDGRVLIIQSKYRGSGKTEEMDSVSHFCEVLKRLHSATQHGHLKINQKLQEAASDIDWESDYFYLYFLTLGKVGEDSNIRKRIEDGATQIAELPDLLDRTELQLLDEGDLNERLREALSAGESLDQEVSIHFRPSETGSYWIEVGTHSNRRMYVGLVSGSELADLYRTYKYRLFSLNIRDYVGDTSTNKAIVDTALKHPEDFLYFNNGVSAVASHIEDDPESGMLSCRRFSIINGAQTVRSLRKAQVKDKVGALKNSRVLLRISNFQMSKDHEFLTDITRYNNTQNSIKISDFRSNDPVQKDLARKFQEVVRGGKTYWYKNKRSRELKDRVIPIGLEDLAKTVHAFRFGPDDIWGGTKYMFDIGAKGGYEKVFGMPVSNLTDNEFKLLAGTFFVCEEVRSLWEGEKKRVKADDRPIHPSLERRWMVYFTVGELLRFAYRDQPNQLDEDLRRLWKPQWLDERENTYKACISELFAISTAAMAQTYDNAAKSEGFRHRNWFRSEGTLLQVRSTISNIPTYRGLKNPLPRLK